MRIQAKFTFGNSNRRLVDLSEIYGFNSRFRFFIPYGFSFRLDSVGIKM
ncbi:unnamed protein product [Arabidopsis lyrata]|nr:unnamed protein product [Arabidopsis lyrata]